MYKFFDAWVACLRVKSGALDAGSFLNAEGAKVSQRTQKEYQKEYQNMMRIGSFIKNIGNVSVIWSYAAIKNITTLKNILKSKFQNKQFLPVLFGIPFGISFGIPSASSAKPSRPLRSKMPPYFLLALSLVATQATAQTSYQGIGRPATQAEVKAWDIDVRPDFKGLPKGQGSVQQGEKLWEAQCASCHGSFGENNEVFTPLIGFTSKKDIETGRVASLQLGQDAPTRTSMMKVSQLSTLWDYINRAMPWTAPKSLSADEVYAVTAYMLNLAHVLPDDGVLSDKNMAEVQKRLPNRLGASTAHSLWPGKEFGGSAKPDVQGDACLKNCAQSVKVASFIPDYARDAHGNLAEQSRNIGPSRGAVTLRTANVSTGAASNVKNTENTTNVTVISSSNATKSEVTPVAKPAPAPSAKLKLADVSALMTPYACTACHAISTKLVGPSFNSIVAKQGARSDALGYLSSKIKAGGQGVYGAIPMPAQGISQADANKIATWLVQGAAP